jgi:ankyrin repeat protein
MSNPNPRLSSTAFKYNTDKVIVDPNHDLFPGHRPVTASLSSQASSIIPLFGIDGHISSTNDLFDMQLGNMSLQSGHEIPSAVISSLFKGLLTSDVPDESSLYQRDMIRSILPRLQVEILERHDGELIDDFERLLGTSPRDTCLQVIKFALYLSSNNMLAREQVDNFLSWMVENGQRAMSIFQDLLSYKLSTVEAFVHTIFLRAVHVRNVPVAKAIIESDLDLSLVIKSPGLFAGAIIAQDLEFIQLLLTAGAEPHMWGLEEAIETGNTELARLFLPSSTDLQKWFQTEEHDIYLKYPGTLLHTVKTAEMAQLLLDLGIDVNGRAWDYSHDGISTPLHAAIENIGDINLIRTLIRSGANVNALGVGECGATPLMMAVLSEHIEIVEELLDSGAQVDVYCSDPEHSGVILTELQLAACHCSYDMVEVLLSAGSDVNKPAIGSEGKTALQWAVENDDESIVRMLLEAGAYVNAPDSPDTEYPRTPLLAAVENGNVELVRDLLDAGADVNAPAFGEYGSNALEAAIASGQVSGDIYSEISSMLLEAGGDIALSTYNSHRRIELQAAVSRADLEKVQFLLEMGVDVNVASDVLHDSIIRGDSQLVDILLRAGADVNAQGYSGGHLGYTPLQQAVKSRHIELVKLFLKEGAIVNARGGYNTSTLNCDHTALQIAIEQVDVAMVEILLQAGAEVNTSLDGLTPLHRASVLVNKVLARKIVKLLLSKGAFLNIPPAVCQGRTILQAAIETSKTIDDCGVARLLIEAREKVNAPAALEHGRTALQLAVEGDNLDIVRFLLSEGASINAPAGSFSGRTALQVAVENACKTSTFTLVDFLLDNGADVNGLPGYDSGRSALQIATSAEKSNIELTERLLKADADVNLPAGTARGLTALQGAAIRGHTKQALMLLKAGAQVNAPGAKRDGRTALEGAAEHGRLDMVQILLNAGADSHLPPKRRYARAAELAEDNNHFAILKILRDYQARGLQEDDK